MMFFMLDQYIKVIMSFKCPICPTDDPMNYVTKEHLVLHINHNHREIAEIVNKRW